MCGLIVTTKPIPHGVLGGAVAHRGTLPPLFTQGPTATYCHTLMPVQGGAPVYQPYGDGPHLVFQGELWHHPGYTSDTAYLYHHLRQAVGMQQAGAMRQAVAGLRGMFAFCFDTGDDIWFATDPFGEQPLFYSHTSSGGFFNNLVVASERKQLRACGVPWQACKPAAPGMLYRFHHTTGTLTAEPYHQFVYDGPRTVTVDHGYIRTLVQQSCEEKYAACHLQRPALLLSGGVDSAIMASVLAPLGLRDAFTVALNEDSLDFATATTTAKRHGLRLHKVQPVGLDTDLAIAMSESKNRSVVEEYVCHLALAKCLADEGYRVVFTGSGADELFCGYPYYLRFTSRKDPSSMAAMQQKLMGSYHSRELRVLNMVYMSQAIECRSPFLSVPLAEYATTLDIAECMVDKGRMKACLRDAYMGSIDSADNEKIIAGRSMGVIDYFADQNGGMDARVYHPRHKEIFSDNTLLQHTMSRLAGVQYRLQRA